MPLLATLLLLSAPPRPVHRFIHYVNESAVGEVELRRTDGRYDYLSRHFFRRGARSEERFSPPLGATSVWASESMLAPRGVGCWAVEDELTRQRGEACVVEAGAIAKGTLLGQPFVARYEGGALQQLELPGSRFVRSEAPVDFKDPFGAGFPLTGSGTALALSPPLEGARPARPRPAGESDDCLAAANRWAKDHPGFEIVLGLLEDQGRGWPHAWVRNRASGEELDPSRPRTAPGYLALPRDAAPRVYLELLGRRRALLRVAAP